jgi:hypothetical protein
MKIVKLVFASLLLLTFGTQAWGQLDTLYAEYFTDGSLTLDWFSGWEGGDNMNTLAWPGNPSGDGWVGSVGNTLSGGGVGSALAGELNLTDYELYANIYCKVTVGPPGPYNAIVARWDTVGGNQYYYFRADFDADQRLQLRKYPAGGMGETIAEWVGAAIPGGVPTTSGWHNMGLKLEGNQLWAYWDGNELSGSPFTDSYSSRGFFGVYIFNFMGSDSTYCDDIIVLGEAGAQPFDFVALDNHYLDEMQQELTIRPAENQTIYFSLDWDAINGSATSPAFDIVLEIDQTEVFRETNPGVEPNSTHETLSDAWIAELGEHTLTWTLDADNQVPEGNEDNNVLEETFLVLAEDAPDLAADSSWVATEDTVQYTVDPGNTDPVRFVLFWSVPMGGYPVSGFDITMDLDGEDYYLSTIPFAQPGENYMAVTDVWTAEEGFHYYEWYVDATNAYDEFSEGNNAILAGFDVGPVPGVQWEPRNLSSIAEDFRFSGIFPNPFNPDVTLQYENVEPGIIKLTVYDVAGREVAVLTDGFHPSGVWEITWSGEEIAAGMYFAVLEGSGQRAVQPLLLVK